MHAPSLPLRLLAAVLCLLWGLIALAVLIGYHPGGPVDALVAAAAFLPAIVAAGGIVWPPAFADQRQLTALGWLAIASAMLVIPSLVLLLQTLAAGGRQTLLPSPETAYAAALALATTCLFVGFGMARAGGRGSRAVAGTVIAVVLTLAVGGLFGGAAVANELSLRETSRGASPFGPTDQRIEPRLCSEIPAEAAYAQVELDARSELDGMTIGTVELSGLRAREAERWTAQRMMPWAKDSLGFVRVGSKAWLQQDGGEWAEVDRDMFGPAPAGTLDRAVRELIVKPGGREAAEDLGQELISGARSRHCRFLVDGSAAQEAFVPLRWLAAPSLPGYPLAEWRGELDYWLFADGQLGMAKIIVSGYPPADWPGFGLQGSLSATITATQRSEPVTVEQPIP